MITHYVRISDNRNYGDYVLTAYDWDAMNVHHERKKDWVAVEDAVNHSDACVRAREYVEALKALEEPKVYDYGASVILNEKWNAVVEK